MKFVLFLLASAFATGAAANPAYYDYKDWLVVVEDVDETLRICRGQTGGDGDPVFSITVTSADVELPPHAFPVPRLRETAPRGYATRFEGKSTVYFETDTGWKTEGHAYAGLNDEGLAWGQAEPYVGDDGADMLREMRQAGRMYITWDGETVYAASLAGFTAAYGKMAEQCGFTTEGVL